MRRPLQTRGVTDHQQRPGLAPRSLSGQRWDQLRLWKKEIGAGVPETMALWAGDNAAPRGHSRKCSRVEAMGTQRILTPDHTRSQIILQKPKVRSWDVQLPLAIVTVC